MNLPEIELTKKFTKRKKKNNNKSINIKFWL